jgi:hypothetical protein
MSPIALKNLSWVGDEHEIGHRPGNNAFGLAQQLKDQNQIFRSAYRSIADRQLIPITMICALCAPAT